MIKIIVKKKKEPHTQYYTSAGNSPLCDDVLPYSRMRIPNRPFNTMSPEVRFDCKKRH